MILCCNSFLIYMNMMMMVPYFLTVKVMRLNLVVPNALGTCWSDHQLWCFHSSWQLHSRGSIFLSSQISSWVQPHDVTLCDKGSLNMSLSLPAVVHLLWIRSGLNDLSNASDECFFIIIVVTWPALQLSQQTFMQEWTCWPSMVGLMVSSVSPFPSVMSTSSL